MELGFWNVGCDNPTAATRKMDGDRVLECGNVTTG